LHPARFFLDTFPRLHPEVCYKRMFLAFTRPDTGLKHGSQHAYYGNVICYVICTVADVQDYLS